MDTALVPLLRCPACAGELDWAVAEQAGDEVERARARCRGCGADHLVEEGVAVFLAEPSEDLWQRAGSGLARHLAEHPDVEERLLGDPLPSLAPADALFRSFVLDERGDYEAARAALEVAFEGLYTTGFRDCLERELRHVVEGVGDDRPVVDVASGRCTLVERLARAGRVPLVATDVSPAVLLRARRRLDALGLGRGVSFVACDARRLPFRDSVAGVLTSHLGLANVEEPGPLLSELRRVCRGRLLAVSHFYPEDDERNRAALRERGLETLLVREPALAAFEAAGWRPTVANACVADALPTPAGELIEGAQIDALPVAPTVLEWCVLDATPA